MNPHQCLDELFASLTDFELCNALCVVIEENYGFDELLARRESIPRDRWVIHSIWSNSAFFECEGYSFFWGTRLDHLGYAESLEEIGFPILASIIRDYYRLVPPDYLGDWDAVDFHSESESAREKAAKHMDAKFLTETPDITGKTAKYIRLRRYEYLDLLGKMESKIAERKKRPSI